VEWANSQIDTTPANTGWPTNVSPSTLQKIHSDSSNLQSGAWNFYTYNGTIWRNWKLKQDNVMDTVLAHTWAIYNRDAQEIEIGDNTSPIPTSTPNGSSFWYSQYDPSSISAIQATDNCGVWDSGRTIVDEQGSNSDSCNYYTFPVTVNDSLYDPSYNDSVVNSIVQVNLDPIQFTYVPPSDTVDYWIDWTDPANTGGYATAMNPAGNSVSVSIADSSLQDPDPTVCEHYNFPYFKYHWASNDLEGDCEADSVYALQHVWVKEELAPSRDYTPGDTVVPLGGNIHPDFLGWSYGTDTISNVTPTPQYWDDVLYQGYDSIYIKRSHWVEDICGTHSDTGYQYITQMVMPWVFEGDKEKNIKVYPNPVDDLLNVIYDVRKPTKGKLKLVDHYGRTLKEEDLNLKAGENKKTYDLREYAPAMYYLNITTPEKTETRKIIKN